MLAISAGCQFEVQRGPDWLLVRVRKVEAAPSTSSPFAECVWQLLEQHFTYRLMLELDQVVLLDSSLIGQLIQLHKRIREHDGIMRLCGLSSHNRSVLHTCALDDRFRSYDSRVEAIMGGADPRHPK
jgi:anti-anti-sigma factor